MTELAERLVRQQFAVIETGDPTLADTNVTADYVNHRSASEPLPTSERGPHALQVTATWLRRPGSADRPVIAIGRT